MTTHSEQVVLTEAVELSVHGDVAVLQISNPPVNGIGHEVRRGVADGIARSQAEGVRAIVIIGEGRAFCGGADISQFNTPAASAQPSLRKIVESIAASEVPVIAAIHGFALGGGLELALGCHYRIMERDATIGLPEVNLGLVPGGGATQRLPRLIGLEGALDIIQSGRRVSSRNALELGAVDELFSGPALEAGLVFARSLHIGQHPRVADLPNPSTHGVDFELQRAGVRKNSRNEKAQLAVIEAVEASTAAQFEAGLDFERSIFDNLVDSTESLALRHLFAAERAALKVPGIDSDIAARSCETIAIIGAGTMGSGIAMACANNGIEVTLIDVSEQGLARGRSMIEENYSVSMSRGKITQGEVTQRLKRITFSSTLMDAKDVDMVIEAVFEDMKLKQQIFAELDAVCKPGAVLASNTSRLDINEIARATERPGDVVGLHFFSPANVMRLLEVARGEQTSPAVLKTALAMAKQIGKTPVVVGVCEGFVGNRMLTPYWREAWFLLEEGAQPAEVDAAMEGFGMAMGPLATADLAGLDINWATRKRLAPTRRKDLRYPLVADRICEAGRFGRKSGAGYYRYEPGNRLRFDDDSAAEVIAETSRELAIERRDITGEEIVDRCVLALVNEGAKILDDGIAARASDIDVVYVNGYGFPASLGGPMYYAEQVGLAKILEKIEHLHQLHGEHWQPANLLTRLVAQGKTTFGS
ncbi:3-hydroxyacyl-CoA dehydrogenase NAD-binding domain-containing protein [Paeniglutamicibacter sp. MACA_103]|uniref:3-hydroxyacyl-CoA dehydrogenase NAD-binding domain-containing protein n=1 Tax=Paeniglutamicibacter sp. MACA_103 TaxID=3377337 RepID=UPI003893D69E